MQDHSAPPPRPRPRPLPSGQCIVTAQPINGGKARHNRHMIGWRWALVCMHGHPISGRGGSAPRQRENCTAVAGRCSSVAPSTEAVAGCHSRSQRSSDTVASCHTRQACASATDSPSRSEGGGEQAVGISPVTRRGCCGFVGVHGDTMPRQRPSERLPCYEYSRMDIGAAHAPHLADTPVTAADRPILHACGMMPIGPTHASDASVACGGHHTTVLTVSQRPYQ
jgi:hypothetical protein